MYETTRRIAAGTDTQQVIKAVAEGLALPFINRIVLVVFERDTQDETTSAIIRATWYSGQGTPPSEIGTRYTGEQFTALKDFFNSVSSFLDNTQTDERLTEFVRQTVTQLNIGTMASLALFVGERQVGVLLLEGAEPHHWTQEETSGARMPTLFSPASPPEEASRRTRHPDIHETGAETHRACQSKPTRSLFARETSGNARSRPRSNNTAAIFGQYCTAQMGNSSLPAFSGVTSPLCGQACSGCANISGISVYLAAFDGGRSVRPIFEVSSDATKFR